MALKFLPPEIRRDATALDDLKRETMKSRKLTHPNIIRIHDFCQFEGEVPFISMEFVEGTTLAGLKVKEESRCFRWETMQPWARQLCAALDYAHGEGVVHRDLKPSNLMLDARGRLKLADFGLAATISDSMGRVSMNMGTSGTPSYMSPQQMDGRPPKTTDDIYALGATLYELLTSKPPFYSGDILHQVRNLAPDPVEQRLADLDIENPVPGDVAALLLACLSKDAARRPQSAAAVAEFVGLNASSKPVGTSALAAESASRDTSALEDEPPSQAETGYSEAASEPVAAGGGMPRWVWGAVAAGVAVLAVVIGVVVKGNQKTDGGTTQSIVATPKAAKQSAATGGSPTPAMPAVPTEPVAPIMPATAAGNWIPMFNGTDLEGWSLASAGGAWQMAGGNLVGNYATSAPNRAISFVGRSEADFRLRFSSRFTGLPHTTGFHIFLRHNTQIPAAERVQYQLSLYADGKVKFAKQTASQAPTSCSAGDQMTIRPGPNGDVGTTISAFPAGRVNPVFKPGDWTAWHVLASNNTFTVFRNNQPVLQAVDGGLKRQSAGQIVIHVGSMVTPSLKAEIKDLAVLPLVAATTAPAPVTSSPAPVPLPRVDASFSPNGGADRQISHIVNAPGGKFVIFGGFKNYDGKPRPGVARLNSNGSLDESFNPQVTLPVNSVIAAYRGTVQADGRVLLPLIRIVAGKTNYALVRLDAVGNLDATFRASPFTSSTMPLQATVDSKGRIYCNAPALVRLNPDGSSDATFQLREVIQGTVSRLSVQKDDKILVAGRITRVGATPVGGFARFLPDGRLDTTFTGSPGAEAGAQFNLIEEQADGKIWIAGTFATVHGQPRKLFARLLPDGKLDASFMPQWQPAGESASVTPRAITVQTTSMGGILVGGQFVLGPMQDSLAHFQPNGQMDTPTGRNGGGAWGGTTTPEGDLVLVGQLKTVFGTRTENIVRLKRPSAVGAAGIKLPVSVAASEPGFVPLFGTGDLSEWQPMRGQEAAWSLQGGTLVCRSQFKSVRMRSQKSYRNFELRLSFRVLSEQATPLLEYRQAPAVNVIQIRPGEDPTVRGTSEPIEMYRTGLFSRSSRGWFCSIIENE